MQKIIMGMTKSGLLITGILMFVFGLGYFLAPEFVRKINRVFNAVLFNDDLTFSNRIFTGIFFIVLSFLIFYFVYSKGL